MTPANTPPEVLAAGHDFRDTLRPRADMTRYDTPLWYGWALMDSFVAGDSFGFARAIDLVLDRCSEGGRVLATFADDLCTEFGIVPLRERTDSQ